MKQLFFKTVRSNGDSVWSQGPLKRNYKVGKRYIFPPELPAHVFVSDIANLDSELIYKYRQERNGGERVLVCYGEVEHRDVPCLNVGQKIDWDLFDFDKLDAFHDKICIHTSTDFEVLGEIFHTNREDYQEAPVKEAGVVRVKPELLAQFKEEDIPAKRRIFFKTVRSTGQSVHARGKLRRTYEIGKRYKFPEILPAHVFNPLGYDNRWKLDSRYLFHSRAESSYGNRVLVCYGLVEEKMVPYFNVEWGSWNLVYLRDVDTRKRNTSTDFTVIGELVLPEGSERPSEYPFSGECIDIPENIGKLLETDNLPVSSESCH